MTEKISFRQDGPWRAAVLFSIINPDRPGLSLTGRKGERLTQLCHNERGPQEI